MVATAASPSVAGATGRYDEDLAEAPLLRARTDGDGRHGLAPYAVDPANAAWLWDVSLRLLGRACAPGPP